MAQEPGGPRGVEALVRRLADRGIFLTGPEIENLREDYALLRDELDRLHSDSSGRR